MGIDISSTTKTVLGIRNISGGCWQAIAILRALKWKVIQKLADDNLSGSNLMVVMGNPGCVQLT